MQAVLLVNIGNRDLLLEGQEIRPARTKGKEILDDFATYRANLSLPILSPVIQAIQAENPRVQIDLVLFCTDQERVQEKFRENDTLYFGGCIREFLKGQKPVSKVFVRTIPSNPTLYDSMFSFFEEQLVRRKSIFQTYEKVFVSLAGGIPACNMALCFQAVRAFEERCVPLYPVEGRDQPVPLQIGKQLLESSKREIIRQQLRDYEYAVAASLLDSLGMNVQATLARLVLYRLNFDFEKAQEMAAKLVALDLGTVRSYALSVESEIRSLRDKHLRHLILELYHNAAVKFQKGEYLDFLGRLFRFQEAVLRYCLETSELALTTDIDPDGLRFTVFQASVRKHPSLVTYLEEQIYNGERLNWQEPYIPCLMAILRFLAEKGPEEKRESRTRLLARLQEIQELTPLRNKSPLGHGFEGASLEKIHKEVPGFSPERLKEVLQELGLNGEAGSPYDRLNALILEELS